MIHEIIDADGTNSDAFVDNFRLWEKATASREQQSRSGGRSDGWLSSFGWFRVVLLSYEPSLDDDEAQLINVKQGP